jgi:hypothetical protein
MKFLCRHAWVGLFVVVACSPVKPPGMEAISATNHPPFPIGKGATHEFGKVMGTDGTLGCDNCHRPTADSFTSVRCDQCHRHTDGVNQRLHLGVTDYGVDTSSTTDPDVAAELRGAQCYSCHPTGAPVAYSHAKITTDCAQCHAPDNAFAALPLAGFTHPDVGAADCAGCHVTTTWKGASLAPNNVSNPAANLNLTGLMPTFTATTIARVTPLPQSLPMPMNHQTSTIDGGVLSACATCHDTTASNYANGTMHWSLGNAGQPQPARCAECHGPTQPLAFVGPISTGAPRTPPTGAMRHDAVSWANGAPTTTAIVSFDCVMCHQPPDDSFENKWNRLLDGGVPVFHAAVTAAGKPQPTSCLDCHANSRPTGTLTGTTATLPPGLSFDHTLAETLDNCGGCHASTSTWTGGRFHLPGAAVPTTCASCHEARRPTTTVGWQSTTYTKSPFDYVGAGTVDHGAGEDCAVCHSSSTSTWVGGRFPHGPTSVAANSCLTCHTTQRPTAVVQGFDHSLNGTGDCRGCHQASVRANRYLDYVNPSTGTLPGGDWQGGQSYPGDVLVTSSTEFVPLTTYTLTRNASNFVTGFTTQNAQFYNAMLHTAPGIPSQVNPGSATTPDNNSCWHCHTHNTGSTTVTAFINGKYHQALDTYSATPGGTVMRLPQPTSRCIDCHESMRPNRIVEKSASVLQPMDHSATFTSAVTINGQSVTGVASIDCSVCHKSPGASWNDGKFHASINGATPSDCVTCHYPLMASAQADVTSGTDFAMKHRSPQLTLQRCDTCHTTALASAKTTPIVATLWRIGGLHANLAAQPTSCLECHSTSDPTTATQSSVTYTLTAGSTTTNARQWMSHTVADVAGKDCAVCHTAHATNNAFATNTVFHPKVASPAGCAVCHGTTNGKGTTIGTNNNLPTGLTSSRTTTTSSTAPGAKDQITHADLNVTSHDCSFCHTQKGTSSASGVMGVEWKQATFHRNFTTSSPLVLNGGTARCSNCHVNVRPGTGFNPDHTGYTATSAKDCGDCHAWPGTSTGTPNWLGATSGHASSGSTASSTLDCNTCHGQGGSSNTKLSVPAANHYGGISNGNTCKTCHIDFTGFGGTVTNVKYPHTNATANGGNGCSNCHVFTSSLYTTLTNTPALSHPTTSGGHQFSQSFSVTGSFSGRSFTQPHTNTKLTRCGACHQYSATTATTNVWTFKHRPSNPGISNSTSTSGCNNCH